MTDQRAAVLGILVGFTGFPLTDFLSLTRNEVELDKTRVTVRCSRQSVVLPSALGVFVTRYVETRDRAVGSNSQYLFPGRPIREPM